MRVLVTGATGFLGRSLAVRLAENGTAVRALVRPGRDTCALQAAGVELALGDVLDVETLRDAVRGCSHVIHLAAAKTSSRTTPAEYRRVNVGGTRNLADAAQAEGILRFVYGSTLGVHGFVTGGQLDESSPIRPNTPYRVSKFLGENVLRDAHRLNGLPLVIARISTVVGCGAANLLPWARAIHQGRFRLIGDGSNHLDLVALDDLVDGLWKCAMVPDLDHDCFVLGSGEAQTVRTFAGALARALGKPAPGEGPPVGPYRALLRAASLTFQATGYYSALAHGREALVADKRASSARAREELGYQARRPIEAAVGEMIAGFVAQGL